MAEEESGNLLAEQGHRPMTEPVMDKN